MGQFGTIIAAVKRDRFAILAADRLWHRGGIGGLEYSKETCRKVVIHPTLPLAAAVGGYCHLPIGTNHPTADYLADAFRGIKRKNELTQEIICGVILESLQPLVSQAIDAEMVRPEDVRKVEVFLAFVTKQRAAVLVLRIRKLPEVIHVGTKKLGGGIMLAPDSLGHFYSTGKYGEPSVLYGDQIADPKKLAAHLRQVLIDGIIAEARMNGGESRECGGGVDVVLITTAGARVCCTATEEDILHAMNDPAVRPNS